MDKPTVGEFLATLRKEGGYTQQDVADKLNISDRTLSSWETGRTEPDLSSLAALADFYGLTVDEILRGERSADRRLETAIAQPDESDDPVEKFSYKRNACVAVGVISALVLIVGSLTLLLTAAPLWLDFLFIFAGAVGTVASLVFLFRFESQTFSDGADNETKLALTHSSSFALIFNSLAYICGAIVIFICYYTTDNYSSFDKNITNTLIWLRADYAYNDTFVVFFLVYALVGLILLTAGVLRINISARYLGNTRQKTAAKYNVKLFKKLCGFGAIPVALSLLIFIIFSFVKFSAVDEVYFTANGVDELRKTFQTVTYEVDREYIADGTTLATIPKGEYYLNFESENFIECMDGRTDFITYPMKLYDLGNGFYGEFYNSGVNYYHLKDGVTADEINPENFYQEYFVYAGWGQKMNFESPDGEQLTTYSVTYHYDNRSYWYLGVFPDDFYNSTDEVVLTRSGSVYTYQKIVYYDYSPLLWLVFSVVSAATVLTCTAIHLVKRKKIK